MKNKLAYLLKNLLLFGLSKGVAFLAPILFVKFITLEEYGGIEFSYSTGSVCAVVLSLGLGSAYPYFILKQREIQKEQIFFLYGYLLLFVSLVFLFLFHGGIISQFNYFICLFSSIFSLQSLYSSILKSNDKGYIGVLYDGGYYFLLLFVIFLCHFFDVQYILTLRTAMEIYLGMLLLLFCYKYHQNRTAILIKEECYDILKYSSLLILSGIIVFWLTSSPRIYIKYLMGYEQVGIYSLYFRFVGISVVIYQFCYIAFFKKLYLASAPRLDKYFFILILAVFIACFIVYFIYPFFAKYLLSGKEIVLSSKLYVLLGIMMPIWVGIALNEGIISRENVIGKMNLVLGIQVLIFPLVLFLLKSQMTLELFTFLNVLMFGVAYLSQIRILKSRNILLNKCQMYVYLSMLLTVVYYFVF